MRVKDLRSSKEALVSDKFNLVALTDCHKFVIDKVGHITAVLQLNSNVSDSLDDDRYVQLFNARKQAFELLGEEYHFSVHSVRERKVSYEESAVKDQTINILTDIWNKQFTNFYETKHYLALTTKNKTLLAKTVAKQQQVDINKLDALEYTVKELLSRLGIYDLELLTGSKLISFWASRINGRNIAVQTEDYLFDDYIADTELLFPVNSNYFIFNHNQKRYSCFLSIKSYPNETTNKLFREVERLNAEFNIYQHYYSDSVTSSIKNIDERIGRLTNVAAFNQTAQVQLMALKERLTNDEVKLFTQNWNIQIFADSLEELNEIALEIKTLVERRNLLLMRETKNLEACFWAIFPTWEHMRVRKYQITSDNLAHFITFSHDSSGLKTNSWGDKPVAKFLTTDNSVYNFSFHESSENDALGNTVVIGASGTGKTTLISFLLSQATKYNNFKSMVFDRGYGFKIFANVINANYNDFSGSSQNINPLQLPEKDRTFLQNWLENLLQRKSDKDKEIISNALDQIYQLKKNDRTLENIATSFGKKGSGSIRNALEIWLKKGANSAYFNSVKDALDFENDYTFFDTTILLDNPDVLGAVADYLFHRMKSTITEHPSPHAIIIDEANKYLASDQFAPKIKETSEEIRKLNGILVLMIQTANSLFENKIFQEMKDNFATYILFPNHKAEVKYYVDRIGLNNAEFNWIKTSSGREVMIKKNNAETVILNIDFSPLDKYLRVFNSSARDVKVVNELQGQSEEWLDIYLNREQA